ncbi:MAG: DUF4347 domain-containing protein, partial [Planctomycetes bacterium]|nr:DUF4347 domain-containing protein [Planctomycetota bacterium]
MKRFFFRQFMKQHEKQIRDLLSPYWRGSGRSLKKYVCQFLKPYLKNGFYGLNPVSLSVKAAAIALLILKLHAEPSWSDSFINDPIVEIRSNMYPAKNWNFEYREVVFVDPSVEDFTTLMTGLTRSAHICILDPRLDGVMQIEQELKELGNIRSIHIVSHGEPGKVFLGNSVLSEHSTVIYQDALHRIGQSMAENGDILLYGCHIASGGAGARFLDVLADATGADVTASDDLTANLALGGDVDLEIQSGKINSLPILSGEAFERYPYALHTATVSTRAELNTAIATAVGDGSDDTITLGADIALGGSEISIDVTDGKTLTIDGAGSYTLDANYGSRVLNITGGSKVQLKNITVREGLLSGNGANGNTGFPGGNSLGAGINNGGTLTILDSTITG